MPLNSAESESESQKLTIFGFNDVTLGCVNDQFQTVLQELADTMQYPFTSSLTTHQYGKVVSVSGESMASSF